VETVCGSELSTGPYFLTRPDPTTPKQHEKFDWLKCFTGAGPKPENYQSIKFYFRQKHP